MSLLFIGIGGLLFLAALGMLCWRLASQRHQLPCPTWLRWLVELDNPFTRTNRAAVIIELLRVEKGMTVLDAGCGPGRLTIPLARMVGDQGRVMALDLQEGMLARTRQRAADEQIATIELLHGALGEGCLPHNVFDRAVLVTVLGEIPQKERAMRELFAALRPGGILSVTEVIFDPHFQRQQTVQRLAQKVGFQSGAVFGTSIAYTVHVHKPAAVQVDS